MKKTHRLKIILPILLSLFLTGNILSQESWFKKIQFGLGTSFATHDLEVKELGPEGFVSSDFNYSWGILSLKWRYPLKKFGYINFNANYGRDYYLFSVHFDERFYPMGNQRATYARAVRNTYTNVQLGIEKVFLFSNHPNVRFSGQAHLSIGAMSGEVSHDEILLRNNTFNAYELNAEFGNNTGPLYRLKINIGPAFSIGSHEMSITVFSSFNLTGQKLARGEYQIFNGTSVVSTGTIKSKVNKAGIEFAFFFNAVSKRSKQ